MNYWVKCTLILSIFYLSNCSIKHEQHFSTKIDSLIQDLHKSDTLLHHLKKEEIKTYSTIIDSTIKSIKTKHQDSIKWEDAKLLSKYNRLLKSFNYHSKKIKYLTHEVKNSLNQLNNLKTDINNNIIPKDSIQIYFKSELDIAFKLDSLIKNQFDFIEKK